MPSTRISPEHSALQVPGTLLQEDGQGSGNQSQDESNQQQQQQAATPKSGPIFSISRLTQMARARTVDQSSPVKLETASIRTQDSEFTPTAVGPKQQQQHELANALNKLHRRASRLKSQSSILSFSSQGPRQQKPIDVEGDKFLRRFATNNQQTNLDRMSPLNSYESPTLRKLCLNL